MNVFFASLLLVALLFVIGAIACVWMYRVANVWPVILAQPVIGLALLVLVLYFLNSTLNVPVGSFADPVAALLSLGGVVSLALGRRTLIARSVRHRREFGLLLLATVVVGAVLTYPSLGVGLNWLSYGNEDWTNYLMGSQRLRDSGLWDDSRLPEYFSGSNFSQAFWFLHARDGVRPGAEQLLAFLSSIGRVEELEVYMAFIVALAIVIGLAASAVFVSVRSTQINALWVFLPVTMLPNSVLAVTYQLVAQVGGVAISLGMCALAVMYGESQSHFRLSDSLPIWGGLLVVSLALIIWYPEIAPFAFGGLLLSICGSAGKNRSWKREALLFATFLAAVLASVLLLGFLREVANFFSDQVSRSKTDSDIFPYYLKPLGLPAFWGFLPIWGSETVVPGWLIDALILLSIFCGLVLIVVLVRRVAQEFDSVAIHYLLYVLTISYLFVDKSGFGLFKIAMWQQPYLILFVVTSLEKSLAYSRKQKMLIVSLLSLMFCMALPTSLQYLKASSPGYGEGLNQVSAFDGSTLRSIRDLRDRAIQERRTLVVTDENPVSLKIVTYLGKGARVDLGEYTDLFSNFGMPTRAQTSAQFGPHIVKFPIPPESPAGSISVRLPSRSVINGAFLSEDRRAVEASAIPRLVFVPSSIGSWWSTPGKRFDGAFSIPEPDPSVDGGVIQAFSRFALFRIENSPSLVSLNLAISSSYLPQHDYQISDVVIYGRDAIRVSLPGYGSANLNTPEFAPKVHAGVSYVLIDFGVTPKAFPPYFPSVLSRLYGQDVERDPRQVSVFVRNLSLHGQSRECGDIPPSLARKLAALTGCYSGIFEDGWMSTHVILRPNERIAGKKVRVSGYISSQRETESLSVRINGKQISMVLAKGNQVQFEFVVSGGLTFMELNFLDPKSTETQSRQMYLTGVSVLD